MTILLEELIEKLKREDEVDILEKLSLTTEDILERFQDTVEERYYLLVGDYEAEEESEDFDD